MLRFNRAIDKGCGLMIRESEGTNTVLAVTQGLRPATGNIIYSMKQTEPKYEFQPKTLADIDTVAICGDLNDFEPTLSGERFMISRPNCRKRRRISTMSSCIAMPVKLAISPIKTAGCMIKTSCNAF